MYIYKDPFKLIVLFCCFPLTMELVYVVAICLCSLVFNAYCSLSKFSNVKLEENGYRGVIVGISSDVPENPHLVEIIKEMFTNASSDLYRATKSRAYFQDVIILIPPSWTSDRWDQGHSNITFKNIDVTIIQSHGALEGGSVDLPYTKQIEGCGKPGVSIYMTSQFIHQHQKAQHLLGNYGKILVHEWGHYRWGLFDEYPNDAVEGRNSDSFYFSTKTKRWEPVGCSNQWEMVAVKRIIKSDSDSESTYIKCKGDDVSGYEEGCVALPSERHKATNGSIMEGNLKFQKVPMFCDSDSNDPATLHNAEAPNRQNMECGGKSAWGIMREHEDFKEGRNPPRYIADITPTFNIIRSRPPRVMFVIDISNEMKVDARMSHVAAAVNCFIKNIIPDGTIAGVVVFGRQAYVYHELHEIDRTDPGGKFENWFQVNVSSDSDSSIENGFIKAVKALSQRSDNGGGNIILITAGKEGNSTLMSVYERMGVEERKHTQQGIIIDALIYDDNAAAIFDIVDTTGGKVYFITNSSGVEGLLEALSDVMSRTGLKLLTKTENVGLRQDSLVNYRSTDKDDDEAPISSSTQFNEKACPVEVSVRINWDAVDIDIPGIKPFAVYAEVHRCDEPIIDVEVTAIIERPTDANRKHSKPFQLKLLDNGAGADLRQHDGVYSRYFTQFTGPGIYGVTVQANNDGTAKVLKNLRNRLPRSFVNLPFFAEDLLSSNFSNNDTHPFFPGQPIGDLEGESLHNFTIGASGGATRVKSSSPGEDLIPPCRITDLTLVSQSTENSTVTLNFTAPGDDYDNGHATRYYIHISNSSEKLVNNPSLTPLVGVEDIIEGNTSSPSDFGTPETFVIKVHIPPGIETISYHFGVIAEDEAGNRGNVSRPVQAVFQNLAEDYTSHSTPTALTMATKTTHTVRDSGFAEDYLSTDAALTTMEMQHFSTDIFSTSQDIQSTSHHSSHSTPHPTALTMATKTTSAVQPEYCGRHTCVFLISLSVILFVCPILALVLSLFMILLIRLRRKCSKVNIQDVELTEQSKDHTANRA